MTPKKKNSIILDSGYGGYLKGEKPKAVANEFLYHNPSLLFWTDELVCDSHALREEAMWAQEGFVVSEITVMLEKDGIISSEDFSKIFKGETNELLKEACTEDSQNQGEDGFTPYLVPEIENKDFKSRSEFYDINCLLYLSARRGTPYVNTKPTDNILNWKIDKWSEQLYGHSTIETRKQTVSFESIFDIKVPCLELFPKTDLYYQAEAVKSQMLKASHQHKLGGIDARKVERLYAEFHQSYKKYDQSVRSEVLDNYHLIMKVRSDKRLSNLRSFIENFSSRVELDDDQKIEREIRLKLQRELLEIEAAIAEKAKGAEWIDNYNTKLSFPIEAITTVGGLALGALSQNPLFLALAMAPSFVAWVNHHNQNRIARKHVWQSYLHDSKIKFEQQKELFAIDRKLKALE